MVVLVGLLCLAAAQSASAASGCRPLPGRSGLDQYCETIPGPTGDRGAGTGSGTGRHVAGSTRRQLRASGAAGQSLLGLIDGSSGQGSRSATRSGKGDGDSSGHGSRNGSRGADNGEPSGNVLSAVRSAADSGGTVGPGFVWIIAILAVALAGIAWVRYRVRGRSS